jgi:hypothetical protein
MASKPKFETYVGIDYSGAGHRGTRTASISVYLATGDQRPREIKSPASTSRKRRNWNRLEVFQWLNELFETQRNVIVGMDHGFSFPISYFDRYGIGTWDQFLDDFTSHWPTHEENVTVTDLRVDSRRKGGNTDYRLTEQWTSSAKSVFQFDVQGSVAKSTHCGIPFLALLRERFPKLHCWPFDGFSVPRNRSMIAEVYPSLLRNRYDRASRTVDQQDAYAVCRWLQETDRGLGLKRYLEPPLTQKEKDLAQAEGWILGVG